MTKTVKMKMKIRKAQLWIKILKLLK